MKKTLKTKSTFSFILFILILCLSFVSCSSSKKDNGSSKDTEISPSEHDYYNSVIAILQNKIEALESEQNAADSKNQQKLEVLQNRLDSLESTSAETESSAESSTPEDIASHFIYTTSGNKATITGYVGNDEELTVPSYIDGYKVEEISESAFKSKYLKKVTISNGIKKIGWFAFYECPALISATIPSSVESIGHTVFSSNAKFTVYCHESSFAHQYAKSYGIDHVLI